MLIAAWENEQAEIEKKEKEVRIIFAGTLLLLNLSCKQSKVGCICNRQSSVKREAGCISSNASFGVFF